LVLVLACDALVGALTRDGTAGVLLAGLWVGLAFQAKMIEAWLVLPALAVGWIAAAPGTLGRRLLQITGAVIVAGVVSLSWMSAVSLVPHTSRPYVDGSAHDSYVEQVFVYNGLGRPGNGQVGTALPGSPTSAAALAASRLPTATGPVRLLHGAGGRDIGWLVPAALVSAAATLVSRRRRPRGDLLRAGALVWGTWLLVDLLIFSTVPVINAYYTAALAPAIAALCGLGVETVRRSGAGNRRVALGLLGVVVLTVLYGLVLSGPAATSLKVRLALVAAILVAVSAVLLLGRHDGTATGGGRGSAAPRRLQVQVACACALGAALLFPLAASVDVVQNGLGPFDTPYQAPTATFTTDTHPSEELADLAPGVAALRRAAGTSRFVAAAYTSDLAAYLIAAGGGEIEPIGGYSGTIPTPTLADLRHQVETGQLRTVIVLDVADPRMDWVRSTCTPVRSNDGNDDVTSYLPGTTVYHCGTGS